MITNTDTNSPGSFNNMVFLENPGLPLSALEVNSGTQPMPDGGGTPFSSANLPITVFLAYVSVDNEFKDRIEGVLETLQFQGCSIKWICYDVDEAVEIFTDVSSPLKAFQLFLFLLSPDFVRHPFCYSKEVCGLVKRHLMGVWVSPILLRVCRWQRTPFVELPILPDSQPITKWPDPDDAYDKIAVRIERAKAQAVVVLLTGDDFVQLEMPDVMGQLLNRLQARPNVLFEAGIAFSRCGKGTILVRLGNVRSCRDMEGRSMIKLTNKSTSRGKLMERLISAGCLVQRDGNWHSSGNFEARTCSEQNNGE